LKVDLFGLKDDERGAEPRSDFVRNLKKKVCMAAWLHGCVYFCSIPYIGAILFLFE